MSATAPRVREVQPRRRGLGTLRHRNYRLLLGGLLVSRVGSWIQSLAQTWLVLQLTHSALMVGTVLAVQHLPALLALPLGHPLTAHYPRRRLLQVTQAISMLPSLLLFAATAAHMATFTAVLIVALAQGIVQAVETPTRQALVLETVGREDLVNAMSFNSTAGNLASVVGPATAGMVISTAGLPACFLVNAVCGLSVIAAIALIRDLPSLLDRRDPGSFAALVRGARYVRRDPIVGAMLVVAGALALFATNRLTVLPLFADKVLHAGPLGFGFLMAALGLGTLMAGLALPLMPHRGHLHRLWTGLAWPLLLAGFAASRSLPLSLALLFLAGVCASDFLAGIGSRLQVATPEQFRGAVVAFYSQVLIGVGPLGAVQAGALTDLLGAPTAVAVGAGLAGLVLLGVRLLQPIAFTFELED